jgi:hypothetical protein
MFTKNNAGVYKNNTSCPKKRDSTKDTKKNKSEPFNLLENLLSSLDTSANLWF